MLWKLQDDARHLISSSGILVDGRHNLRLLLLLFGLAVVQDLVEPGQGVNTQIQQRAAGQVRVHHSVVVREGQRPIGSITAEGVVGNDSVHGANSARLDQLADLDTEGEVASPDCLHQEQVLGPGRFHQLPSLGSVHSESLLAKDVLARLHSQHGVLEVVRMGSGDVDNVDVGICHQLGVRAIRLDSIRGIDFAQKARGAVLGGGRGNGNQPVRNIVYITARRVGEEILGESYKVERSELAVVHKTSRAIKAGDELCAIPPVAKIPHLSV